MTLEVLMAGLNNAGFSVVSLKPKGDVHDHFVGLPPTYPRMAYPAIPEVSINFSESTVTENLEFTRKMRFALLPLASSKINEYVPGFSESMYDKVEPVDQLYDNGATKPRTESITIRPSFPLQLGMMRL